MVTEVLKSLAVEDVSTNIRDASQGTCNWILHHDAFKFWMEQPSQPLWICGKPGSGKTILLRSLIDHFLESVESSTRVTSFFFSHRGAHQSMASLLKCLLFQLLKSSSNSAASDIFVKFSEKREILGSDRPWDEDVLTENFLQLIDKSIALGESFYFVIDGLDECSDPDRVVSLFQRLTTSFGSSRGVRCCISSRHGPSFVSAWEIRMEDNNYFDIQKHLNNKLVMWQYLLPSALESQAIIQTITDRSQGMFPWASLVLAELLRESYLNSLKPAQHLPRWLPLEPEAAYESILERLWSSHDARRRRTAQKALILVACAQRPLSTLELLSALDVTDERLVDHQQTDWAQGEGGEVGNMYEKQLTIPPGTASQLMILCGCLLEVSPEVPKSTKGAVECGSTIQLINESFREFLLDKCSIALETRHGKGCKADFHFRVAQICLTYIEEVLRLETLAISQPPVSDKTASPFHFLKYAVKYGMRHLGLAGRMGVTPKSENIWQWPSFQDGFIDRWAYLHNRLFREQSLFKPRMTKAAHVMSYFGLPWLDTGIWGASITEVNEQDHHGHTALSFAAAKGNLDLCRFLVQRGADVRHRDYIYGQTPLSLAAAHGHGHVVKFLLHAGSSLNDHDGGVSALWVATRRSDSNIVQLLLDAGASATTANAHTGETALSLAAALGHLPIVALLLRKGAEVESCDNRGWTPLHYAVSRGRKKTLELLLGALRQDQLRALRTDLVKGQHWVHVVLRSIILGLYFNQCGQSEAHPRGNPQESKTSSASDYNETSATSNQKRGRHKLGLESGKNDCGENQVATKKRRYSNIDERRFACPYHKRNAAKYPRRPCNGMGFGDIHRLK